MAPRDLDLLRAYVDGTMAAADRDAFARRLALEPELAEWVQTYALVAEAGEPDVPDSLLRAEDVDLALGRGLGRRTARRAMLATAAAVLLGVGIGWWLRPAAAPTRVTLAAIPLAARDVPQPEPNWPATAATWQPFADGRVVWLRDLQEAYDLARYAQRPLLLWVDYPGCPICTRYEKEAFRDPLVGRAAEEFVLARLSWQQTPQRLRADPRDGWPRFHVLTPNGRILDGFAGYRDAGRFAAFLDRTAKQHHERGQPDMKASAWGEWARVRSAIRLLKAGDDAQTPAAQETAWRRAVACAPASRAAQIAAARLERLAQDARRALQDALAAPVPATALQAAAERFADTRFAAEFAQVQAAFDRAGRAPQLVASEKS